MLTNARRRWPAVEFRVVNVAVQGPAAVPQMIDALAVLDKDPDVDVIILARGGGSVEDLLPFSDEALCRAVSACRTPIISAIGHETDTPLVDFVADLRASTPTDAAKRVVPDLAEEWQRIGSEQRVDRGVQCPKGGGKRTRALRSQRLRVDQRAGMTVGHRAREVLGVASGQRALQGLRLGPVEKRRQQRCRG